MYFFRSYEARFVGDVTIPDGYIFKPNVRFTKMWAMVNSGHSLWDKGCKVIEPMSLLAVIMNISSL